MQRVRRHSGTAGKSVAARHRLRPAHRCRSCMWAAGRRSHDYPGVLACCTAMARHTAQLCAMSAQFCSHHEVWRALTALQTRLAQRQKGGRTEGP